VGTLSGLGKHWPVMALPNSSGSRRQVRKGCHINMSQISKGKVLTLLLKKIEVMMVCRQVKAHLSDISADRSWLCYCCDTLCVSRQRQGYLGLGLAICEIKVRG
jgi:hypothetical protein